MLQHTKSSCGRRSFLRIPSPARKRRKVASQPPLPRRTPPRANINYLLAGSSSRPRPFSSALNCTTLFVSWVNWRPNLYINYLIYVAFWSCVQSKKDSSFFRTLIRTTSSSAHCCVLLMKAVFGGGEQRPHDDRCFTRFPASVTTRYGNVSAVWRSTLQH